LGAGAFFADARVLRTFVPRRVEVVRERRAAVRGVVERIVRSPISIASIVAAFSSRCLLRPLVFFVRGIGPLLGVYARGCTRQANVCAERDRSGKPR
jgi:hypothetical protein